VSVHVVFVLHVEALERFICQHFGLPRGLSASTSVFLCRRHSTSATCAIFMSPTLHICSN
jgi:hypothetical protein